MLKIGIIESKSDIFGRRLISYCVFRLGREIVGIVVTVLTNVDYQIVRVDSRNVSSEVIFLAYLLGSYMVALMFLMGSTLLKYLALL